MKKNNLTKAINSFKFAQRILKEDYGFGPQEEEMGYDDMRGEMPQENIPQQGQEQQPQDITHYRGNEGEQHMEQEENQDMNLSKSDERIAQIREVALDGLQDYAEDVDSEAYQFYKKIWLMCDKAVSEKDSASNGGGAA